MPMWGMGRVGYNRGRCVTVPEAIGEPAIMNATYNCGDEVPASVAELFPEGLAIVNEGEFEGIEAWVWSVDPQRRIATVSLRLFCRCPPFEMPVSNLRRTGAGTASTAEELP
jgi:transcription antitermination factor NusG